MQTQLTPLRASEQSRKKHDERLARIEQMLERSTRWYVLSCAPQKERVVETILNRIGFDALVPVELRLKRANSRQKVKKYFPYVMASRYVFLGARGEYVPWHDVFGIRMFSGIIGGDEPKHISQSAMRDLFARSGERATRQTAVWLNRSIVDGDLVTITEGPFKGYQATIRDIDTTSGAVEVYIFQQTMTIRVPLSALESV